MIEAEEQGGLIEKDWRPPVVKTAAAENRGVDEAWAAIEDHRRFLAEGPGEYYRRLGRLKRKMEIIDLVKQGVVDAVLRRLDEAGVLDEYVDELIAGRTDPYTVSDRILSEFLDAD
jgi:LAO/AO transport system kinase